MNQAHDILYGLVQAIANAIANINIINTIINKGSIGGILILLSFFG